jgi:hypothetical protein
MKSTKVKKITDNMIGMDNKTCSCSSIVGDIIISRGENKQSKASLRKIVYSLRKGKAGKRIGDKY